MSSTASSDNGDVKNCFSVDVEGFIESNLQSFYIDKDDYSSPNENYEIERNVNVILSLLDDLSIKATFFYLGRIGRDLPHIVKETAQSGHEIACHSDRHIRIFDLTPKEFKESIIHAKGSLEDISGKRVYGFRAPDFSITKASLWALDVLYEAGFTYDSSICPTGLHDVYGIEEADPLIHNLKNGLIEYPISVIRLFHKSIPFGGGGYLRLYPIMLTRLLISKLNARGHPCMLYIHPYEVGPIIPDLRGLSFKRRFRHYYNCKNGRSRLEKLLKAFKFKPAIEILKERQLVETLNE